MLTSKDICWLAGLIEGEGCLPPSDATVASEEEAMTFDSKRKIIL